MQSEVEVCVQDDNHMQKEGKNGVLMLTRDKFYLYNGVAVLVMEFPTKIVKDMDIKDRDGLFNLIINFIQTNKLIPAQIYFVLAESVSFIKDVPIEANTDLIKAESEVKDFTEAIPFSSVISKTYKTTDNWKVVGVNQDLVDTVFEAFASRGFGLSALVPAVIFPDLLQSVDLSPAKAQIVLSKKELAVSLSMVGSQIANNQQLTTTQTAVPKNKILPYLIIAFTALIVILIVMIIKR